MVNFQNGLELVEVNGCSENPLVGGADSEANVPVKTTAEAGYTITKQLGEGNQVAAEMPPNTDHS
eukprot:59714-Amphidinium_carterae.1